MTDRARLATGSAVAIGGAALATFGARATWFTVSEPGRFVMAPGLGTARFPDATFAASGQDIASDLVGITFLMLVALLFSLLAGRRQRAVLFCLAAFAGASVVILARGVGPFDALAAARDAGQTFTTAPHVAREAGGLLTQIGAAIGSLASLVSVPAALKVRRVEMPETGPNDDEEESAD